MSSRDKPNMMPYSQTMQSRRRHSVHEQAKNSGAPTSAITENCELFTIGNMTLLCSWALREFLLAMFWPTSAPEPVTIYLVRCFFVWVYLTPGRGAVRARSCRLHLVCNAFGAGLRCPSRGLFVVCGFVVFVQVSESRMGVHGGDSSYPVRAADGRMLCTEEDVHNG